MTDLNLPQVYLQRLCPLCDSIDIKPVKTEKNIFAEGMRKEVEEFDRTWVQLMECQNCGFAFCKEIPSNPSFFDARYDIKFDPTYEDTNQFKDHILKQLFDYMESKGISKGLLIDIGSFAGILLRYARERGFDVEGVEVNPTMVEFTRDKLKLNIFSGKFTDFPVDQEKYDVITLIDVLEHLFRPKEILERCYKILKPGGHILIKVPNYRSQFIKQNIANALRISGTGIFATFGHINQFSPKSLNYVLKEVGFTPVDCIVVKSELHLNDRLVTILKNIFRKLTYLLLVSLKKIFNINWGLNIAALAKKE